MMSQMEVRVSRIVDETAEIRRMELTSESGTLPPFGAGSHIDVHVPGVGVRQYSLCNAPSDGSRYVIGVKREAEGKGGSRWLHDALAEGECLTIGMPRNHFPLADQARQHILCAGGIGVTPMLAMAESIWQDGGDFVLLYFARSRKHCAFLDRLEAAPWRDRVRFHFDDGEARIDMAQELGQQPTPETHLYICGPQGFMGAVQAAASAWREEYVHVEYFGAPPAVKSEVEGADAPFEVELAKSGQIFQIGSEETIAQVLLEAGVDIATSCEQGVCGSCVTRFISGEPDHRDFCLSKSERERKLALCCGRSRSARLVLDL